MYKSILEVLICPVCGEKLELNVSNEINGEIIEGILTCVNDHKWMVEEGVINFQSKEQTASNNWSEMYNQIDYDELDKKITERTPQIQLDADEAAKVEIISLINNHQAKKVVDIATGRGMLLTKLVESLDNDIELVCVDLSYEVLKYDRIKANKINPNIKVNYIACDATKMPFLNDAFDLSVSFYGIQNMGGFALEGIKEGVRVSKKGLINAGFIIKDDNPKIDELNKLLIENGYDFKVDSYTESNFYKMHKVANDYKVEVHNVFEGIGGNNENDMIPIEGEWFAAAISKTVKA